MTKKTSITDAIKTAPEPADIATALLSHMEGEGKKKFSKNMFYNPTNETYDAYGYVCHLLGLEIEHIVADDGLPTCTGYAVASDGSKELIVLIANTVLGYDPRKSSAAITTGFCSDLVHLWSSMNQNLVDGIMDPKDVSKDEIDIAHRAVPFDIIEELRVIADGTRSQLSYTSFEPMMRAEHYRMDDQKS